VTRVRPDRLARLVSKSDATVGTGCRQRPRAREPLTTEDRAWIVGDAALEAPPVAPGRITTPRRNEDAVS